MTNANDQKRVYKNKGRVIAHATGAYLSYQYAIGNSRSFEESILTTPIQEAMKHAFSTNIAIKFTHPILKNARKNKKGRKSEVDFAALAPIYGKTIAAVEAKWAGSSHCTVENITWDILRLALMIENEDYESFFLLAGKKKDIQKLFNSKKFLGEKNIKGKYNPILSIPNHGGGVLRLTNAFSDRKRMIHRIVYPYRDTKFSSLIKTGTPSVYPSTSTNGQYQVYVWKIIIPQGTPFITPSNTRIYGYNPDKK
ncbi:hypothetical protein [Nisaea sp.]|uniref:hypothetical protein n=1 Tax=Nisaea sp. TaxID=2024842 RepID=UPI002B26EE71|nr:hypothetical protein [Nisaea sp.]